MLYEPPNGATRVPSGGSVVSAASRPHATPHNAVSSPSAGAAISRSATVTSMVSLELPRLAQKMSSVK